MLAAQCKYTDTLQPTRSNDVMWSVSLGFIVIMMMCNVFEIDMVSFTTELFISVWRTHIH